MDCSKQIESIDKAIASLQSTREKLVKLMNGSELPLASKAAEHCKWRGELIQKASACSSSAGWVECKNPENVAERVTICMCNSEKCKYYKI
jgi:hypothetical protein